YWESCARGVLSIQQCPHCQTFRHLPRPTCPNCQSFDYVWTPVSGKGTVYSYTIAHHPVHPALAETVPYNVIVVTLDDVPVKLVSNLVGVANEDVKIGMPVEVVFEEPRPGIVLPRFRPRAS
ncbi:MAG: hypothetical protein JWQ97_3689, partial [Phenylobacterium sp.]|nr:hypothetical protein [Phenylobacterium sp.]